MVRGIGSFYNGIDNQYVVATALMHNDMNRV